MFSLCDVSLESSNDRHERFWPRKAHIPQTSVQAAGRNSCSMLVVSLLASRQRLWIVAFISFFTLASLLTFIATTSTKHATFRSPLASSETATMPTTAAGLQPTVFDALVNYAVSSNSTGKMAEADLRAVSAVLRRRAPCNLLVFGVGQETPLWRALNDGGRTVFLDENEYYIAQVEGRNPPGLEAYDVAYTTKLHEFWELLAFARQQRRGQCRPVQNLLFSDCRMAINDLPNHLYDVPWDVILVDGPRGHTSSAPGRMSAIFTAAVMARSVGDGTTDVLVHDYEREVERVCSEEFLCRENLAAVVGQLAHYIIPGAATVSKDEFCVNRTADAATTVGKRS